MKKKVKSKISSQYSFFPKNRKGSHIDVVISFVIFVIFLGFLYSIIGPVKIQENKENVLDFLEIEIKEKLSANFTSSSITIPGIYVWDCFEINHLVDFTGLNVIVKDENNDVVNFGLYEDNNINRKFLRIDATPEKRYFKIYYSPEKFIDSPLDETCPFTVGSYYSDAAMYENYSITDIGLLRTDKYVFESKVREVFVDDTKYKEMKESLNLPYGSEFSFSFKTADGVTIKAENKEVAADTYVREVPVQYIDDEANIKSGFINLKIW